MFLKITWHTHQDRPHFEAINLTLTNHNRDTTKDLFGHNRIKVKLVKKKNT